MRLDLGGPALEFIHLGRSATYAAEIDGVRVPMRVRRRSTDAGYGGGNDSFEDWREGLTMDLWDLRNIQEEEPERSGDSFVFKFRHEQHYNAFKAGTVTITYRDGVVEIDADITEQNDSYY